MFSLQYVKYLFTYRCNAKYLWKRIPTNVKTSSTELGSIWAVGQNMWKRDFPAIYKALNAVTWSDTVAEIMKKLHGTYRFIYCACLLYWKFCFVEKVRSRAVDLISQAYSSITLEMVAAMTGLSVEAAGTACVEHGWTIEADTHMVHPVRPSPQPSGDTSSEDQLYKLTDFVSFLEN